MNVELEVSEIQIILKHLEEVHRWHRTDETLDLQRKLFAQLTMKDIREGKLA